MPQAAPAPADFDQQPANDDDDDLELEHQLTARNLFVQVMSGTMKEAKADTKPGKCDKRCTPNIRALAVSSALFTIITLAQVFAAIKAHSHALMTDCVSMGVDALTYLGNIVVECRKTKPGKHVTSQLIVVGTSLTLLCFFTYVALKESWETIMTECRANGDGTHAVDSSGEEEEVNGWITLAFALGGVSFDFICMAEFYRSNKRQESVKAVNMFSAFLHVGADFLRSTSTTVMSLVILTGIADSTCADAYTSVIIGATIIAGAFLGFWKWVKMLIGCISGHDSHEATVG